VPTAIEVHDVTKSFSLRHTRSMKEFIVWTLRGRGKELRNDFNALDGVSFTIEQGESVALLGFNGSGKSTMLKLISGVMLPDNGRVGVRGRVAGLIEVGAGFHERFDEIVAFSEIEKFIDTEVKFYSSGMFLRLAFSVAAHSEPDIFLIDEILAVGDEPFQRKCLDRIRELRRNGHTLIIVSHDLDMVQKVADRGVVLDKGVMVVDGPISEAVGRLRGSGA